MAKHKHRPEHEYEVSDTNDLLHQEWLALKNKAVTELNKAGRRLEVANSPGCEHELAEKRDKFNFLHFFGRWRR